MSPNKPAGKCSINIAGLGDIEGWQYDNGVRQFCGIPYATLGKRWTRSKLRISLDNNYHDGTKLGPRCAHPEFEGDDVDDLTPVAPFAHFNVPKVDERNGLVMNIVLPPVSIQGLSPIFVYVHGGSLLYGGAYLPIFDSVRLVSQSVEEGRPIIAINFNYRVGLGGFLASSAIERELAADGYEGCGNFGFTDQKVAFDWVQRYGTFLNGDIGNVTACGESAGGISISNQLLARDPPKFHRTVCMSGLACSIPAWNMDQHQNLFNATCAWFGLDPTGSKVLEELRRIPEQELADASPLIFGVPSGTGNPCLDGVFYEQNPLEVQSAPTWLKSYMLGDVYHEGVIFHLNVMEDTLKLWHGVFHEHIGDLGTVKQIFDMYGLNADTPHAELLENFEHMAGDAIFRIPNYLTAIRNERLASEQKVFLYHFDQRSNIKNALEGTAYHAYELLYLFRNREEEMSEEEKTLAVAFASSWIKFTHGMEPWNVPKHSAGTRSWKVWGQHGKQKVVTESEDEQVRKYARFDAMINIGEPNKTWYRWIQAIDAIVNKRWQLGSASRPASFDSDISDRY